MKNKKRKSRKDMVVPEQGLVECIAGIYKAEKRLLDKLRENQWGTRKNKPKKLKTHKSIKTKKTKTKKNK